MDGNWPTRTVCRQCVMSAPFRIRAAAREAEVWSFNQRVTPTTYCLLCTSTWYGAVWWYFGHGCFDLAGICVRRSLQSFGEATRLPRMLVACRSVPVSPFLVSLSRNVGVMRSISVVALHLVSFSSHLIHLHVRSVWSHAASLFPYFGGCVCASRGVLENACDWPSV